MKLARRLVWAALAAGAALRAARLGSLPITSDEGFMLRTYANQSFSFISTHYLMNNHELLTLLARAIDAAWPKKLVMTLADPWPLELPSLAAALASLWLMAETAGALAGPVAALFATLLLSLSYWHLMYSSMIRGYSLSVALELAALWLALKGVRERRVAPYVWAALAAAAAHAVIPTNAAYTLALGAAVLVMSRSGRRLGLAAAVCAGLTLAFYWPVLGQIAGIGAALPRGFTFGDCFLAGLDALGASRAFALGMFAVVAAGLALAARGGRRSRAAAAVAACYLVIPPLLFGLGRLPGMTRAFLPGLPFACLGAALALRAACARRRLAVPALALACAAACAGQAARYWSWNRGLEPRDALARVSLLERDGGDFMTLVLDRGDDRRFGEVNWEYYGLAASLEPYWRLAVDRDLPYYARERYVVLSSDEAAARRALEESGAAELAPKLALVGRSGRLGIYEARRDRPASASGDGERARFLRARAAYLAFDDRRAVSELEWLVARDTGNVDAPLMLAHCLAALGRVDEARKWLAWYSDEGRPPQAWIYKDMAAQGLAALAGGAVARRPASSVKDWLAAALEEERRGAYARAAAAIERARRAGPIEPAWEWKRASLYAEGHDYARAERLFKDALAAGGPPGLRVPLARVLRNENDFDGARAQLELYRKLDPRNPNLQALAAELDRL